MNDNNNTNNKKFLTAMKLWTQVFQNITAVEQKKKLNYKKEILDFSSILSSVPLHNWHLSKLLS